MKSKGRWPAWKVGLVGLVYMCCIGVLLVFVTSVLTAATHIDLRAF